MSKNLSGCPDVIGLNGSRESTERLEHAITIVSCPFRLQERCKSPLATTGKSPSRMSRFSMPLQLVHDGAQLEVSFRCVMFPYSWSFAIKWTMDL
jgi:hypothetical protein